MNACKSLIIKYRIYSAAMSCLVLLSAVTHGNTSRPKQPNVILIHVDELGLQDIGCYETSQRIPIDTPNIDRLADEGLQFWQAYAASPAVIPSRAAILNGEHPARAQKTYHPGGKPPTAYHRIRSRMIDPWTDGRIREDGHSLAQIMQQNGYITGYPVSELEDGVGNRDDVKDERHQNVLTFIEESSERPFFLFYIASLSDVTHQSQDRLIDKYREKLGITKELKNAEEWGEQGFQGGQTNPYYCAQVEMLDSQLGSVFSYLKETDDPRWIGHQLIDNTYVILTSSKGVKRTMGASIEVEQVGSSDGNTFESVQDRLLNDDELKVSVKNAEIRVPFIISGPRIQKKLSSGVIVSGLDLYPTVLSLAGLSIPKDRIIDGVDLSLLMNSPSEASLVKDREGVVRSSLLWHFPHSKANQSALLLGDFKLIKNYDYINNSEKEAIELYRVYKTINGKSVTLDLDETDNLVAKMPEKVEQMSQLLTGKLDAMNASTAYYNPNYAGDLPDKKKTGKMLATRIQGDIARLSFKENGAKVVSANLIYTLNGGADNEEWFKSSAEIIKGNEVLAQIPEGTTHYVINLIDENNYLLSFPELPDRMTFNQSGKRYAEYTFSVALLKSQEKALIKEQ